MVKFLVPLAIKVIDAAVDAIPENLDDLIKRFLIGLAKKAVSRTDNTVDDQLVEGILEKDFIPRSPNDIREGYKPSFFYK